MKKLVTSFCLITSYLAYAQQPAALVESDMPAAGENYIYNNAQPIFQFDANQTGDNFTWDYTNLQSISETTDSFMAVLQTPLVYNLVFNLPFDPNRATVANNLALLPSFGNIPLPFPVTFSNENSFYRTSSSSFKQVGVAMMADYNNTTIPLPVKYDEPDVIYSLPLDFGQTQPTTTSRYEFQIPGLMTFIENKTRTNTVDGRGTLLLPNGSFAAFRVKSELEIQDSIFIDTLGFWLPSIPRQEVEYKWVSQNHGWPLLEIRGQQITFPFNQFQVSEVKYAKLEPVATDIEEDNINPYKVYPIPAGDVLYVEGEDVEHVYITDFSGKLILDAPNLEKPAIFAINLNEVHLSAGMYILTVKGAKSCKSYKLETR